MRSIPLCEPHLAGNEWSYVKDCLDTGWVSSVGQYVQRFEERVADRVGRRYAVATVNGTSALHTALLVAGVKPDDEVLVSSLTFVASANVIRYVGAWPVFIDAEPKYWQMDPQLVRDFLHRRCVWRAGALYNRASRRRIGAIVPVHILGHPVDMQPIVEAARQCGLPVIEDATESLGAQYRAAPVGALGDIACFSFNGNKLITTGGGGMLVTDDCAWAAKARGLTTQCKNEGTEYIHDAIGYNYRLTNVLSAIGLGQMEQLDDFIARKRAIARTYNAALEEIAGIEPSQEAPWAASVFWMYTARIRQQRFGMESRQLLAALASSGIQSRPLWQPLHLSPAHEGCEFFGSTVAEDLYHQCLSLPCSVGLRPEDQERVIAAIANRSFFQHEQIFERQM